MAKNQLTLGDEQPLDNFLKPIKVGGEASILELSSPYPDDSVNGKVAIRGDLQVDGNVHRLVSSFTTGVYGTGVYHTQTSGDAMILLQEGTGISMTLTPAFDTILIGCDDAATNAKGVVELATTAETTTGTDTTRAVTPDGLKDGYEGSSNIETVGDLAAGAITSGFGAIDVGSSSIDGGVITCDTSFRSHGTVLATGPEITSAGSDDYLIGGSQTLNDTSVAGGTQEYAQIKTDLTATDLTGWDKVYLTHQQVDGASKFRVNSVGDVISAGTITSSNGACGQFASSGSSNISYRGNTINTWYVGNQSLGTSITNGDFGLYKLSSAMFNANHGVNLQGWNFVTTFSSSHDFEVELWDIELPSAGGSYADSATQVGATQSVTATALKIYALGQQSLDYVLEANHQLYLAIRYTDGSGTFYTYGTVSMEFTNA